jgi:hypothetical protein
VETTVAALVFTAIISSKARHTQLRQAGESQAAVAAIVFTAIVATERRHTELRQFRQAETTVAAVVFAAILTPFERRESKRFAAIGFARFGFFAALFTPFILGVS